MKGKKIIGITLIFFSIGALVTWEKWGKNQFIYDEILVVSQNIEKGTVITEKMIEGIKFDSIEKDAIKVGEEKYLIGKEASQFIHKGVPIFREYINEKGLFADEEKGEYIMAIPDDWLISRPFSIERGSRAFFYAKGKYITSALVTLSSKEEKVMEIVVNNKQTEALNKIINNGYKLVVIYN